MHARAEQSARERDEALRARFRGKNGVGRQPDQRIGHDFNNLLTVMSNVSELLRIEGEAERP